MPRARTVIRGLGMTGAALALAAVMVYALARWPAYAIPVLLVLALLGWWRFYHSLMRRAEAAEHERRRRAGRG